MINVGDLIQETGKPVVRCTSILDEKDLTWMSLDGKSSSCDAIFYFKKLEKEEFVLTPEETIKIVCNENPSYDLLHMHEADVYYGDMSNQYTFDIIFEEKETKKQFVIQGVKITEGTTNWFENYDLEDDFLDDCDRHNIKQFTAQLCVYNPAPPYIIIN